ncbi:MAG: phosphate/phosphite/phosphonate ABC transporter substrate-binding protein [Anaerolineae bacterium]|nr:phosphate/phosphite/phosphonate ABC transporter substrate-binding protein [Anaerolineae bacterium]MDW8172756.1 phosphate/phosphite/phosphonate ABC transporter substrate-binding protein [Anaerolineae bacterium]
MKKFAVLLTMVVIMLAGLSLVSAQEVDRTGWPETFIIGVYPGDNVEEALAAVEPLRVYLEERLGVRTVLITGTSYNSVIEAMAAGRADAMEVGPFSYVLAAEVAKAEAIAVANYSIVVDRDEVPGYFSLMFTKKGSGIKSIADLEGRSFGFTDPASTSGYLVPATDILLDRQFTDPAQIEEFAKVTFTGNHPNAVLAVANDNVEAAATFDANLPTQAREIGINLCGFNDTGAAQTVVTSEEWPYLSPMTSEEIMAIYDKCPEGSLVVFHQSPLIPETPFAVRGDLPESFKMAVKEALLDVANDEELVKALERYYVDPTEQTGVESIDAIYDSLRDIARLLNIDLRRR